MKNIKGNGKNDVLIHLQAGIFSRLPLKKSFLTEVNRLARLNFARENVDFQPEHWNNAIFLDEKTFSTTEDGKRNVWRPLNKALHPKYVAPIKYSGRTTLGYWGFISVAGAGDLVEIGPHFNAAAYVNLLEYHLKPQIRATLLEEDYPVIRIVQDNSGVHRARLVQAWYDDNPDFEKVAWPALAQDLNPIENLWGLMQKKWISGELRNKQQLRDKVTEVWEDARNNENLCQRLIHSLPKRLQAVVDNNGYWTKY